MSGPAGCCYRPAPTESSTRCAFPIGHRPPCSWAVKDAPVLVGPPVDQLEQRERQEAQHRGVLSVLSELSKDMKAHPRLEQRTYETVCPICRESGLVVLWLRAMKGNSKGRKRRKQTIGAECKKNGCIKFRGH